MKIFFDTSALVKFFNAELGWIVDIIDPFREKSCNFPTRPRNRGKLGQALD